MTAEQIQQDETSTEDLSPEEEVTSAEELLGIEHVPENQEEEQVSSQPTLEERLARMEEAVTSMATESKKFQSLYDKNLSQWENLQKSLGRVESQEPKPGAEHIKVPDPWDPGYNDWLKGTISDTVKTSLQSTLEEQQSAMNEKIAVQNLVTELKGKNFSDQDTQEFIEFWAKPQGQIGIDTLVDVFLRAKGKSSPEKAVPQKAPTTAAQKSSLGPRPENDGDRLWRDIQAYNRGQTGIFGK